MATIKLVHWSATKFHPFNQHLAGEFMHTLPGGRLSILPESSGVLQSKSPAGGGIVVTVQHNLPCPSSPIMAIPVGVCIAPESVPVILRTREKMTTNACIVLLPPLLQSQMRGSVDFLVCFPSSLSPWGQIEGLMELICWFLTLKWTWFAGLLRCLAWGLSFLASAVIHFPWTGCGLVIRTLGDESYCLSANMLCCWCCSCAVSCCPAASVSRLVLCYCVIVQLFVHGPISPYFLAPP